MSKLLARLLTRSFPGNRNELGTPALNAQAPPAEESYESRAFAGWNELIAARGAAKILDLGPLRAQALAFFSERQIDLGILNLAPQAIGEQLAQFSARGPSQGALCWDLPNYCQDDAEIVLMGEWLAERLTTGAPVFLALATKSPYAERPAHYEVVAADRLRATAAAEHKRSRIWPGSRLNRYWPAFDVKRSYLLRNGMQEFVLTRR